VQSVCELTFRWNASPPSTGSKISQARNQSVAGAYSVIRSSDTSVQIRTTRRYSLEDSNIHNYCSENLKSYIMRCNLHYQIPEQDCDIKSIILSLSQICTEGCQPSHTSNIHRQLMHSACYILPWTTCHILFKYISAFKFAHTLISSISCPFVKGRVPCALILHHEGV
jgi:hypothetical protein